MSPVEIFFLALAMSSDAFAVAVAKGSALDNPRWTEALRTGAIFGCIEAATPLVGWALGRVAIDAVGDWNRWIAFGVLAVLGLRMVVAAVRSRSDDESARPERHAFWVLALTGLATSLDAMAVGAGLAIVNVAIVPIAAAIGCATFVMVTIGVMLGRLLGQIAGRWAEGIGGLLLIAIGAAILAQRIGA